MPRSVFAKPALESTGSHARRDGYAALSRRPLHMLAFLLPFLIAHEVCMLVVGTGAVDLEAHRVLRGVFELFGPASLHMPAVLLAVVLLVWHVLARDRWRLRLPVVGGMGVESVAWAVPLVVLAPLLGGAVLAAQAGVDEAGMGSGLAPGVVPGVLERVTIAVGAGLYEEMLFRLIGIMLFHVVLVDLIRLSERVGLVLAVLASSLAFAAIHNTMGADLPMGVFVYYTLAGCYFGAVFVMRGFGVVVGAHIVYDLVVLIALPQFA